MKDTLGTTGLIFNEPLLWEKGKKGRSGFSHPRRDVASFPLDEDLTGEPLDFPDLSEVDVVRHYTRLSQWNFGVDTGMYPLGSCTMKYNPKINEKLAGLSGFSGAHPLLPERLSQGALKIMLELERYLAEITGMDATTLQPAAQEEGGTAFKDHYPGYRSRHEPCQCRPVRVSSDAGKIKPAGNPLPRGRSRDHGRRHRRHYDNQSQHLRFF